MSFERKKTDVSAQRGYDGGETPKTLETTEALAMESTGPCPVMRARVSVSLSVWGLCPLSLPALNEGQNRCWLYFYWTTVPAENHSVCYYV